MNSGHEEFRAEHEQRTVETVMNLFRASTLLSRIGGRLAQQVGLASAQQWTLLAAIAEKEGISLKELRRNILVTKQNISSMMDRLRQAGYVRTYEDRARPPRDESGVNRSGS
ncbi:MarR family winged helix-turn-helix transcriptional regulator [Paenibacillus sp. TAB 01]|uniref:MarR family winged helix-turn-helix transcriptional regulator n=1 Tax=Paenibacillus sp. TAB 01 TaxID=3368988 RepID=UPI00374FFBE4